MKKLLFTLLIGITTLAYAQAPQQISYQGVARNASGTVLSNQPIGIKFDIHQGSASGPVVFTETHTGISTNSFGLFTTYIGSISNLSVINWSSNSYFIEVWIDPNTGTFSSLGSQQLMSVPYALNAGSAPAPVVSFTNNILSVGGNTTTIPAGTTYTAGTGISISSGVISSTFVPITPTITSGNNITINPNSPSNSYTVSAPSYSLSQSGNNIDLLQNGTSISSVTLSVANPTTTIVNGNNITLNQSGSTYTVNAPTYSLSQSGNTIDLLQNGTSISTATLPAVTSYSAGPGIDISALGVISNTAIAVTPTITSTGIAVVTPTTGNTFNVDVPAPVLNFNTGTNVLSLTTGGNVTSATLNATGSNTVSIVGSGIAAVTPTTGNTFSVSVPSPTFTPNGPTTITGSYPNLTINSVASPSTTLVQGNNVTLNQSGSTYTVNAAPYSLSSNSNTLTLTNGTVVSTATVPVQSAYVGTANNITVTSNTINLATTGVTAGSYGVNANNSVPTFSVDNFGRLTTASQYTPTVAGDVIGSINTSTVSKLRGVNISTVAPTANQVLQFNAGSWTPITIAPAVITGTGTGIATVTTASTNFTVNVPPPVYTQTTGVLGFGTSTISITPTLSLTGTTLTSGPSTNSVNLSTLPGLWTAPTATSVVTTNSISLVGIGTNTPSYKLDVYANGSVPATIHGYNAGATASSTGVFGENPNNGIGVFGQSNSGKGVWGSSTSDAGIYGESVSGDGGKFILTSTTTVAYAVNAQTNGSGAALYAKSYNATPLAAKFDGNTIINHTSTSALPHVTLVSPTISDFGRFKFLNTGSVNYFALEGRNNTGGVNDAFDISHYNGVNEKQIFLINGTRNVFVNNLNVPLATFHVMTSTATASGGMASEGFAQSGQLNLIRNNNAGAGARAFVFGGDELGKINFAGYDGSTFGDGARIYAKATENVTGATKGTELVFAAVPSGSSVNSDVFKINGANKLEVITGLIIPAGAGTGKVLTSDLSGNASWQTITAPLSPWIQGTGIVTQGTLGDKVGIGTNTPSETLDVNGNINIPVSTSSVGVIKMAGANFISAPGSDNLFVGKSSGNIATSGFNNVAFGNNTLQNISSGANNVGLGYQVMQVIGSGSQNIAIGTNALSSINSGNNNTALGFQAGNIITSGSNNLFLGYNANANLATLTNASAIGYLARVDASNSMVLGSINGINGATANTSIGIGTTTPGAALDVVSVGNINAISATSSGTADALVVKNTNALVTAYAGNFDGGLITKGKSNTFNDYSFKAANLGGTTILGIRDDAMVEVNGNVGINILNPTNRLYVNSSYTNAAIYAENIVTGSFSGAHGIFGKVSAANSNSLAAAVYGNNAGAGPSIYAVKTSTDTGIPGRFEILNTSNGADGIFAQTAGSGAAIHAVSATTSTVGLWVENGHIKATSSSTPAIALTNTTGPITNTTSVTYSGTYNDVKGSVIMGFPSTSFSSGQSFTVKVTYNKSYATGSIPTVLITPWFNDFTFYIVNSTTTDFTVQFTKSNLLWGGSTGFRFNYFVIE